MKRSENEMRKRIESLSVNEVDKQQDNDNENINQLSNSELKEIREFLSFLKSEEANNIYNESETEAVENQPGLLSTFFSSINKTMLFICLSALTFVCWLCFKAVFLSILLILEVLFACIYLIYSTIDTGKITLDPFEDGLKFIQPEENGRKLENIVIQEPVEELQDLVDYIKNPQEFQSIGLKPEKKVLIIGEKGMGKDALIRSFSNTVQLPIIRVNGSRFFDTENIIDKLFAIAKKKPTSSYIIHIEGFEKIIEHNFSMSDDPETLLDKINTYLGAFPNIILIATCESIDSIAYNEEAFTNKFKKILILRLPEQKERVKLLQEFTSELVLDSNINFDQIAKNCYGCTIGELKYIVSTAISISHRNNHQAIQINDFYESIDKIEFGNSDKKYSEEARKLVAYHEAGHALVHYLKNGTRKLLRVISIGRGNVGGLTTFKPDDEKIVYTQEDLLNEVCTIFGGRCAEKIVFGFLSTGPSSDIKHATYLINRMIESYGMSEKLGPLNYSPKIAGLSVIIESQMILNMMDEERLNIAKKCEEETLKLLNDNRPKLDKLANYLIEHESITVEEMEELLKDD